MLFFGLGIFLYGRSALIEIQRLLCCSESGLVPAFREGRRRPRFRHVEPEPESPPLRLLSSSELCLMGSLSIGGVSEFLSCPRRRRPWLLPRYVRRRVSCLASALCCLRYGAQAPSCSTRARPCLSYYCTVYRFHSHVLTILTILGPVTPLLWGLERGRRSAALK